MEKLNVIVSFEIAEELSKVSVKVQSQLSPNEVSQSFDLLPGYPLDNYVKFTLTKYQQFYGTQNQNPPQKE